MNVSDISAIVCDYNMPGMNGADTIQFSPFLNARPDDMSMTVEKIRGVLDTLE